MTQTERKIALSYQCLLTALDNVEQAGRLTDDQYPTVSKAKLCLEKAVEEFRLMMHDLTDWNENNL